MKKLLFGIISILIVAQFCAAQSIKIVPKKVVYKIPDSQKENDNLEIIYPKIKSKVISMVRKNLAETLNYWRNFQTNLKSELTDSGTSLYNYEINYNQKHILDITLIKESMGAYPWTNRVNLLIGLRTGKEIFAKNVFKKNCLQKLLRKAKPKFDFELQKAIDDGYAYDVQDAKYELEDLDNFSVAKKGLTFNYDFGFAYGRLAAQPAGRYFFTWKELRPFIKKGGLFAQFVK